MYLITSLPVTNTLKNITSQLAAFVGGEIMCLLKSLKQHKTRLNKVDRVKAYIKMYICTATKPPGKELRRDPIYFFVACASQRHINRERS